MTFRLSCYSPPTPKVSKKKNREIKELCMTFSDSVSILADTAQRLQVIYTALLDPPQF